jgi:hypothetical protein
MQRRKIMFRASATDPRSSQHRPSNVRIKIGALPNYVFFKNAGNAPPFFLRSKNILCVFHPRRIRVTLSDSRSREPQIVALQFLPSALEQVRQSSVVRHRAAPESMAK